MNHLAARRLIDVLLLGTALAIAACARADALSAVQVLREGGCGGLFPAARPLHQSVLLDRAAEQWARGRSLSAATRLSGYRADSASGLHFSVPDASMVTVLRRSACRTITSRALADIGLYQRGQDSWLVLASTYRVPARSQAPALARRALQLVNSVRSHGVRCGSRWFAPAAPLRLSDTLGSVALAHATDMAEHHYFDHIDLAGRSPAARVRATGYRERLVGENIAYGPASVEEVVHGWLDSPAHCENLMEPEFTEMGIAYAAGQGARSGLYWVQLLALHRG